VDSVVCFAHWLSWHTAWLSYICMVDWAIGPSLPCRIIQRLAYIGPGLRCMCACEACESGVGSGSRGRPAALNLSRRFPVWSGFCVAACNDCVRVVRGERGPCLGCVSRRLADLGQCRGWCFLRLIALVGIPMPTAVVGPVMSVFARPVTLAYCCGRQIV
jgi:hypothetical protein